MYPISVLRVCRDGVCRLILPWVYPIVYLHRQGKNKGKTTRTKERINKIVKK